MSSEATKLVLAVALAGCALAGGLDEFKVKREAVFEFAERPTLTRNGDQATIAFASKGYCDVTVAIENSEGKIVRHLACGVLGPKAPPPLQRDSLKQTLVWDGKDDQERYIDDKEGLSVRVSLGLRPAFERTLFWSPKKRIGDRPPLLHAVEEGVVVFDGLGVDHVRLFDHDGSYVRTIYPFPAGKLGQVNGLRWHTFPQDGGRLPLKDGFVQASLLTSGTSGLSDAEKHRGGVGATAMAAHNDRIALAYLRLNRLASDGSTGGLPLAGPKVSFEGRISREGKETLEVGPTSAAFSPDGKWLYLTGYVWIWLVGGWNPQSGWFNAVLRLEFAKDAAPEVFLGSGEQWATGKGKDDFRMPTAVACDAGGRVYVADYHNDRIQVFSPDGRHVATVAASRPAKVLMQAKPRAVARWVLPVPELPRSRTFSWRSMYSPVMSSRTRGWLSEGWAAKSKVSRVLRTVNLAALTRRSAARRSRWPGSNSMRTSTSLAWQKSTMATAWGARNSCWVRIHEAPSPARHTLFFASQKTTEIGGHTRCHIRADFR